MGARCGACVADTECMAARRESESTGTPRESDGEVHAVAPSPFFDPGSIMQDTRNLQSLPQRLSKHHAGGENLQTLPKLLGTESLTGVSTTDTICQMGVSSTDAMQYNARRTVSARCERYSSDGTLSSHGTISRLSSLMTGSGSPIDMPISSYHISEALSEAASRFHSRHVRWASSPTHSVHRSEASVKPYGEVYGLHPRSFEFCRDGRKIDSSGRFIQGGDMSEELSSDLQSTNSSEGSSSGNGSGGVWAADAKAPPGAICYKR